MSEVDSRPAPSRGRTSIRGGRGGYGRGGPRGGHRQANGTTKDVAEPVIEDQGELGDMKKQYSSQLSLLKDMFPDWTDVDLVFALQETDGDLPTTIDRITEGHVSQFSDVTKKTKDRARSKAKDTSAVGGADSATSGSRGGRGRGGIESSRGGRSRAADRGRGGFRGGRGGSTAAPETARDIGATSVPTAESTAWEATPAESSGNAWETTAAPTAETEGKGTWGSVVTAEATPAAASEGAKSALIPEGGAKKSWASMFAATKPKPAPAVPKPALVPPPVPAELAAQQPSSTEDIQPVEAQDTDPAPAANEPPAFAEPAQVEIPEISEPTDSAEAALTPPRDSLTEDNLENLPDVSNPPATLTAASTVGSVDPRGATPLGLGQQAPIGRPPLGGYASSAYRATGLPGRSASFQRRVLEQQEAVVMPGHNTVDRAAVQFGSMGLNGDSEGLDVDEEREEPETRTQPPQQSPPGQPRASLPPAPIQPPAVQDSYVPESHSTPKQAPGLPPLSQQQQSLNAQQETSPLPSGQQGLSQDSMQSSQAYSQYGRYGQQADASAPAQKSYDPFSHQTPSSAFDHYSPQQQQSGQQQQGFSAFSSAPSGDYSQYYTADQQRNAYQNYYGAAYGQQSNQSQQDAGANQQRTSSGLGSGPSDSGFPASQGPQQTQSRYGEAPGSGNNTPNPSMGGQQQSSGPSQQMHQQQHQAPQYGSAGYPYGHPYYTSPYATAYQSQFGGYTPSGYGAPFGGNKGSMYGQPQGYGMIPPSSYDHSSSQGNAGAFNQQSSMQPRESGLGGGLGEYGRTPSTQQSQHSLGSAGFGGMSDTFGRSQSGYQGQGQGQAQGQGYSQQGIQQSGQSDELKPFGETKATGPSPALGQPGRPGSAVSGGAQVQSGLPPAQGQQAFGGYPGSNQGSQQYGGGLGGLGGHQGQSHQQGGYGGYGGGFGNSYSQYGRGGWGGSYGH